MWIKLDLVEAFQRIGLAEGDLVFVHSALRALGHVHGGADTVIDALLEAVGPNGTVAVPTHTFKVVNERQPVFHQVLTPSNVGAMTNVFRLRVDAVRSLHPTHSVAAIGPRAAELVAGHELDDTPCSPTSPYGRLRDWGGKVLIIGPGLECCTFFHGCEEWAHMPSAVSDSSGVRYAITAAGETIQVTVRSHVINTWDQYPRLEPYLLALGALRIGHIGECPLRLLDAQTAADWLVERLSKEPGLIWPSPSPAALSE